jgi:DNA-binding NtrC family response regulator
MSASLHILIVDDRPDSVADLTRHVTSRGHRVVAALNGMEALSVIQRKSASHDPLQLLITDLNMPQLDGLALLKELHRRQLNLCTALLIDQPQQLMDAKREAERLGCLMVGDKPVDLMRIDRLINLVINRLSGGSAANEPFFGTTKMLSLIHI